VESGAGRGSESVYEFLRNRDQNHALPPLARGAAPDTGVGDAKVSEKSEQAGAVALTTDDYVAIEDAVMETPRGRWFLAEFARRNRAADTNLLLDAIARLESAMPQGAAPAGDAAGMRTAITEMAEEIAAAKREIASIGRDAGEGGDIADATAELDAVVEATESATSEILAAAEAVQEMAWTLREQGVADIHCDALDIRATEIYMACSFQDITGQRSRKVVRLLQKLDERISTLASLWGSAAADAGAGTAPTADDADPPLDGPARDGDGVSQQDIDLIMVDLEELEFDTAEATAAAATAAGIPEAEAETDVDDGEPAPEPVEAEADADTLEVPVEELSQADRDALFA
jgi:chemotaxis regulatin CheY-phosphate phosphatase CheZ